MILSSYGCKVSWALPRGNGECGTCECLGRLAGGIQTANPPTDNGDFQKSFFNHRRPSPERKSKFSLRLVHAELCGFHRGDGGCVESVTIVSMVTIFLTPGVPPKISSRPSPSSRRGLDTLERNDPSRVGTGILVNDSILIFQPACVYIEIPGKGVRFHFQI